MRPRIRTRARLTGVREALAPVRALLESRARGGAGGTGVFWQRVRDARERA